MDGRDIPNDTYRKVLHIDGTRITLSDQRFELSATVGNEIGEQQAVQRLREWIRWRKAQEELRESGLVSR
jgi:hypothetical protein